MRSCIAIVVQPLATLTALAALAAAHGQTTRPAVGLEPGEAEARQRATPAPRATTFTSPATEVRGIWLASRDMTRPRDELRAMLDQLKAANFNTVLIDTYFRGYVAYPGSAHLPQFPAFRGEDILGWLIDECHARGLRAELWMEYGFYSYFTPDATRDPSMGKILDAHPELLSIDSKGNRYIHRGFGDFYSICPSNPQSHQILADVYSEAVRKYPKAQGVNLDRIRYAGGNYCYCDYCRKHFHRDTGVELTTFVAGSREAKRFLQWKREQTTKAVETIARALRAARPGIVITSYVVGPDEMDDMAQGWDLWMKAGLLDGVAVSMYGADIRPAATRAIKLLGPQRDKLICAVSCEQATDVYLTNIQLARQFGKLGQFTWHFGQVWDDIDGLHSGPYQRPAASSLARPRE
jgi:uncharacterized lipoprotein YddW (UPF0748 family)